MTEESTISTTRHTLHPKAAVTSDRKGKKEMTEKRTRRSKTEILQERLDKALSDKEKYTEKIAEIDETIQSLEEELNAQRIDEVMTVINEQGLSIDAAIEKLRS